MMKRRKLKMHTICYIAIAMSYLIAMVAYTLLAISAQTEEKAPITQPVLESPSLAPSTLVQNEAASGTSEQTDKKARK